MFHTCARASFYSRKTFQITIKIPSTNLKKTGNLSDFSPKTLDKHYLYLDKHYLYFEKDSFFIGEPIMSDMISGVANQLFQQILENLVGKEAVSFARRYASKWENLKTGGTNSPLGLAAARYFPSLAVQKYHEIGNYPTQIMARVAGNFK